MAPVRLPASPAGEQLQWFVQARATGTEREESFRERMVDDLYWRYEGTASRKLVLGPLQAVEARSPFALVARYGFSPGLDIELEVGVEQELPHRLCVIQVAPVLEGGGSTTALAVAANRAVHRRFDPPPLVIDDDLAETLVGPAGEPFLVPGNPGSGPPWQKTMVVVRARICEDEVEQFAAGEPLQYVILGAGLDSFAYRRRDLGSAVTVFEVDEPQAQGWKRRRLADAAIAEPPNLRFVPVDFTKQDLDTELERAGFDSGRSTVVSCTGVTYYLTSEAMEALARSLGSWRTRAFVADYMLPHELLDAEERRSRIATTTRPREPMRLFFAPDELEQLLLAAGFTTVQHIGPDEIATRYGAVDHLPTSPYWRIVCGRVV